MCTFGTQNVVSRIPEIFSITENVPFPSRNARARHPIDGKTGSPTLLHVPLEKRDILKAREKKALLKFYEVLNGTKWIEQANWDVEIEAPATWVLHSVLPRFSFWLSAWVSVCTVCGISWNGRGEIMFDSL